MTEDSRKIETKYVTEIVVDDDLFRSNGFSSIKVTKSGKIYELKVPVKSSGITELIEEFKRKEPKPPVIRELVKQDSDLGKNMGLSKNTWVKLPDLSDVEYIKAREKYESELGIAIVLKGLDIEIKDKEGNILTDRDVKIQALKGMGMSGEQFSQIVKDIRELTQWTAEERDNFFALSSDGESDMTE